MATKKTMKKGAAKAAPDVVRPVPAVEAWSKTANDDDVQTAKAVIASVKRVFREWEGLSNDDVKFCVVARTDQYNISSDQQTPSHKFTLAKDDCINSEFKGPRWVPFNLWQLCEYGQRKSPTTLCAKKLVDDLGAEEIWELIANQYPRPDFYAAALPIECAEIFANWQATPKLTPKKFRENRLALKKAAEKIACELEAYFVRWDANNAMIDAGINFTQIMTEDEQERIANLVHLHNHRIRNAALQRAGLRGVNWADYAASDSFSLDANETWDLLLPSENSVVPDLPDLMRRIGKLFADDSISVPLERPNHENAKRNYFVRRIAAWFKKTGGSVSPAIVSRITSVFFPQGIGRDEVSQQLGRHPSGRRARAGG